MKINKVQIRNLQIEDYDQLAQSFTRVYSDGSDVFWTHKQIEKLEEMDNFGKYRSERAHV